MKKILIVVDMQNDFIDGALANEAAQAIVDKTARYVSRWEGRIIFTRDTHNAADYLETAEGKHLPIPHCIEGTPGWNINEKILDAAKKNKKATLSFLNKTTFGTGVSLATTIMTNGFPEEIQICGTCTDICVVSNALALKSLLSEVPMKLLSSLCAGLTKEKHEAAIEVMKSCQIEVVK